MERRTSISSLSQSAPARTANLVDLVVTALDDDKAEDITVIDLDGRSSIADHLVIATGRSQRQVGAMAEHLKEKLKAIGIGASTEGAPQCDWVVIDGCDIVVHLFRPEVRRFYNLEKMWGVEPPAAPVPMGEAGLPA